MTKSNDVRRQRGFGRLDRVLALSAALLVGSPPASADEFDEFGYQSSEFQFSVLFSDPGSRRFLDDEWRLANFVLDRGVFERKTDEYNKDVDLVLEHEKHNGVFFAEAFRVRKVREKKNLDVVLRNIADSLVSSGLYVDINPGVIRISTHAYATFVRDAGPKTIAGQPGYHGTIEIARVAQLQLNPKHRDGMLSLVILRVPVRESEVGEGDDDESDTGLIVVGYYNTPDYFSAGLPAFEKLLSNLHAGAAEKAKIQEFSAVKEQQVQAAIQMGKSVFEASVQGHSAKAANDLKALLQSAGGKRVVVVGRNGQNLTGPLNVFNGRVLFVDTARGRESLAFGEIERVILVD